MKKKCSFSQRLARSNNLFSSTTLSSYEAWVIYNFLSLCLAWVGGPGAVVLSLSGRVMKPSWCLMTCCFPPMPLDGRFIRRCKQGCLQFVILKPFLVAVTLILYAKGKYMDGNFSPKQSYLYLTIIYTISYTLALYALALFYVACKDLLQPFNPVPKFIIIKSVVFLTYWQGVLFFLAAKSGFIKDAEEAAQFQDFIICVEMLIAAVGHLYAFPYKEYAGANIAGSCDLTRSLAHALKLNDLYHDTVHQFAPTYHDYVLYNHTEGDDGTRKYRSRTFVPTGQEMDAVRKNKLMFGNKMDELSSHSSSATSTPKNDSSVPHPAHSDAMKSSHLMGASDSLSSPYDMSLIDMDFSSYPAKVAAANETGIRIKMGFEAVAGMRSRFRYEKLGNDEDQYHEKLMARPRRRHCWVKKMNGRVKGLRLSRSRKLTFKALSVILMPSPSSRIAKVYAHIIDRIKIMDDLNLYPNIILSTRWGLPVRSKHCFLFKLLIVDWRVVKLVQVAARLRVAVNEKLEAETTGGNFRFVEGGDGIVFRGIRARACDVEDTENGMKIAKKDLEKLHVHNSTFLSGLVDDVWLPPYPEQALLVFFSNLLPLRYPFFDA
ncbi:transmembrane protein 184B-like [Populus alba x Populus x berolinensis]|nr:transmembrane protein 184B-like [Populus alba x Populus x berolinensis]